MDRRAFVGLMIINALLAFGNTFAGSFNMIYLFNNYHMPIWSGAIYLGLGFTISIFVSVWMSWRPHIDPRNVMLVGLVFQIAEYAFFLTVRDGWALSILAGVSFGLFYPLFWTPFNILMAQMTEKTDRGVTYGAFFFVWPAATFVAPFLGGLVIGFASYQALFLIGIGIIGATLATIVAYRKYIPKHQEMRIRLDVIGRRNVIAVIGEGGFEGIFWVDMTLVAYTFTKSEYSLGVLFSLFGLSAGIMAIILGKVSDKIQNRRFFVAMSALTSIPCILLIYFSRSIESYALANGLLEFASFVLPVLLFAILTDKLEKTKNDSVVSREYLLDIGRGSAIGALVLMLYLGYTPQQCFLLAIPFLLMGALAHEHRNAQTVA